MKGLSIDIGVHNMAFYIEEFDENKIKTLSCPKAHRYDDNGEATDRFKNQVLKQIYSNGKKVFLDKADLLPDQKGVAFDVHIFINLTNYLDKHIHEFDDCRFVIIEQQMKKNPMAQRIEQHCVSWFTFTYLDTKEIIIFPSRNKTRVLGAPKMMPNRKSGKLKKMTKCQRKKWACDEASKIFTLRNDMDTMKNIFVTNKTKKDDLSDTVVMLQAFKIKCFIDGVLR